MRNCPYCNKKINNSPHIYTCAFKNNVLKSKNEIKFDFISHNFPEISNENNLRIKYEIELFSLPMIRKKYGIDYKSILFLLEYFNIKKRNISESSIKISVDKQKKTLIKKYGVTNVSQINEIKEKKKKTFQKNYGVDNIWKHKDYVKYVEKSILDKYNMDLSEFRSLSSKKVWNNKSIVEKKEWLEKSIHSYKGLKHVAGYTSSKLENKITLILNNLCIPYETQFYIKDENAKCKLFDIKLKNSNIIIEINGDYWHANPNIYKTSDILKFPFGNKFAFEIWNKDKRKRLLAKKHGYIIKYIWESDIKTFSNKNLIKLVKDIVYENN